MTQLICVGPTAIGLTVFGRFWAFMSAIKFCQAVSNGPIELSRVAGFSRTSMGCPGLPESLSDDLIWAVVRSGSVSSAGDLGPQDKSFLLMLRWPLNQHRRPSISRQDQYSRVSGLSRHSMMVSAFAVDKTPSRTMASTTAVLSLLRAMLVAHLSGHFTHEWRT